MSAPIFEIEGLREAVVAGRDLITYLRQSQSELVAILPLPQPYTAIPGGDERKTIDAFLKRFEQAQDLIGRTVFRGAALALGEDLVGKSLHDTWMALEGAGGIPSAHRWKAITATRNALVHEYPMSNTEQCQRLNRAWADTADIITYFEGLVDFLQGKGILP